MLEHEQVEIEIFPDCKIKVDKGLEDIISNFFHWKMYTGNSCIDNNGKIWIAFESFYECHHFMKFVLKNRTMINGQGYIRETLYDYLEENAEFKLHFDEEGIVRNDEFIGNGQLTDSVSLRFPAEDLENFRSLFFEVFPPK